MEVKIDWSSLSRAAWNARENAYLVGNTGVGAALVVPSGEIYSGCNVEHRYRLNDVHAEVNAISNMVNQGHRNFVAILIAANRERFTPCGSCLEWIFQFAGPDCLIGYQNDIDTAPVIHKAKELMPYYPK